MKDFKNITIVLSILLLGLIIISICAGSVTISVKDTVLSLMKPEIVKKSTVYIVRAMRLPRVATAIFAGIILSLSGLVFQCVFRNPMADSYILGISSGSSCFIAIAFSLGFEISNTAAMPAFAIIGSLLTASFLILCNRKSSYSLLLSGIALNFFLSSMTTLFVYLGKRQLDAILYWTMGSLSNTSWLRVFILFLCSTAFTVFVLKEKETMDVMLLDDSTAYSEGVKIESKRILLIGISSGMTSVAVAYCGVIGFIGLMSPHIARIIVGPKHSKLIPVTLLIGAIVLLLSDLISRTIVSPTELPVGIVTSILGSPIFFYLLKRKKHE